MTLEEIPSRKALERLLHIIDQGDYIDLSVGYTSPDGLEPTIRTNIAYLKARDVLENSQCEEEIRTALSDLIEEIRNADFRSNDISLMTKI